MDTAVDSTSTRSHLYFSHLGAAATFRLKVDFAFVPIYQNSYSNVLKKVSHINASLFCFCIIMLSR